MAMFYFSFKANLINYPEISWKITFTHPLRTEEAIYKVTLSIFVCFCCSYLFLEYANKQIWTRFASHENSLVQCKQLKLFGQTKYI